MNLVEKFDLLHSFITLPKQLFDDYIDEMFKRRGINLRYSELQVKYWLIWLAQKMLQESQTTFLIEKMQPTWLETNLQKVVYVLGVTINVFFVLHILSFNIPTMFETFFESADIYYDESLFSNTLTISIFLLIANLPYFLIMLWNLIFKKPSLLLPKKKIIFNKIFSNKFFVTRNFARIKNIIILCYELAFRNFLVPEIKLVDSVKWSFKKMIKTFKDLLIFCLTCVVALGTSLLLLIVLEKIKLIVNRILNSNLNSIIFGVLLLAKIILLLLTIVVSIFLGFSMLFVLISPVLLILNGLSIETEVEKTIVPNQGIWNSLKNTMVLSFMGAIIGTICAIIFQFVLSQNSPDKLLTLLLIYVPGYALWLGFLSLGACNKHFILRIILDFKGYIPWNYARFLDYASERIFLRKVGGGYIFIHRMLMEHFAQMELENKSIQITFKNLKNNR